MTIVILVQFSLYQGEFCVSVCDRLGSFGRVLMAKILIVGVPMGWSRGSFNRGHPFGLV